MRAAILGAGAIGGRLAAGLAAGLAKGGHEVGILARGGILDGLQRDGLTLCEGERCETFRVTATAEPRDLRGADLLVLGLKAHDIPGAWPLIRALRGPQTRIPARRERLPWWFLEEFGGPAEGLILESVDRAAPCGVDAEPLLNDEGAQGGFKWSSQRLGGGRL